MLPPSAFATPGAPQSVRPGAKKPTRRGRKPSTNPLNQHHAAFNSAHAKGDHAAARTHALNYANASSQLSKAATNVATKVAAEAAREPDGDEAVPDAPIPARPAPVSLARLALTKKRPMRA